MNATKAVEASPEQKFTELDRRYGKIGIPAVAAAMRYQSENRATSARTPLKPLDHD